MRLILILSCILHFSFPLMAEKEQDRSKIFRQINQKVRNFAQHEPGGGVIVGIIYPEESLEQGYGEKVFSHGYAYRRGSHPPRENSIFYLASVTKVLTSAVLAKFVEEGRVKLDDPAQKYVPHWVHVPTYKGRQITLGDLAAHTSGLPRDVPHVKHPYHYFKKDFYQFLNHYKLKYAPGTKSVYSNLGFGFLGLILSNIAHMPYEEVIVKELCNPLKMHDTRMRLSPEQKRRVVYFYNKRGKKVDQKCCIALPALGGGGAFVSTCHDMMRFLTFNMGLADTKLNAILPILHEEQFPTAPKRFIDLGWYHAPLYKGGSLYMVNKNGGMAAVSTYLSYVKETKTGVVVLANSKSHATNLGIEVLQLLNPKE